MDCLGTIRRTPAASEIHVAGWGSGIRFDSDRRGCPVHHARITSRSLFRRYPALGLLHPAAEACEQMGAVRDLGGRARNSRGAVGVHHWRLDVLVFKDFPIYRRTIGASFREAEALALHSGADIWMSRMHVGLQR